MTRHRCSRLVALVLVGATLTAPVSAPASAAPAPTAPVARLAAPSSPELVPFVGSFRITATWGAPSGGYHAANNPAIDTAMPVGTAVYAAGNGTVTTAAVDNRNCNPDTYPGGITGCINAGYTGTRVYIAHPDGTTSRYLHLSNIAGGIANGTVVSAGQLIGHSGNTGISTGPHLHYEERSAGGGYITPGNWTACHGAAVATYDNMQNRKGQTIRNDGYGCGVGGGGTITEGGFVRVSDGPHAGEISRVAGGHLMHLETCEPFGGCPGYVSISGAQFDSYVSGHPDVANGTYVRVSTGASAGTIARAVGGALLPLNTCDFPDGGCGGLVEVTEWAYHQYAAAHPAIANGSYVRVNDGPSAGTIARAVGGAVLPLNTCDFPDGGCGGTVGLPQWAYDQYSAAHPTIANGSYVRVNDGPSAGTIARAVGGALLPLNTCDFPDGGCDGTVGLPEWTYHQYAAAHPTITDGTFVRVADGTKVGTVARAVGGALLPLSTCAFFDGCPGFVQLPEWTFDTYAGAHGVPANGSVIEFLPSHRRVVMRGGRCGTPAVAAAAVTVTDGAFTCPRNAPGRVPGPAVRIQKRTAVINWTRPSSGGAPITGYRLRLDKRVLGVAATRTRLKVQLRPGVHRVRVAAVNAVGRSPFSVVVTFRVRRR